MGVIHYDADQYQWVVSNPKNVASVSYHYDPGTIEGLDGFVITFAEGAYDADTHITLVSFRKAGIASQKTLSYKSYGANGIIIQFSSPLTSHQEAVSFVVIGPQG
jgi:hypothetical protein